MELTPEILEQISSIVKAEVQASTEAYKADTLASVNNSLNGLAKRLESNIKQPAVEQPDTSALDKRLAFAELAVGLRAPKTVVQLLEAKFAASRTWKADAEAYLESEEAKAMFAVTATPATPVQPATNTVTPTTEATATQSNNALLSFMGL